MIYQIENLSFQSLFQEVIHLSYALFLFENIGVMQGLITKARKVIDPAAAPFAKAPAEIEELGLMEGANLIEVVNLTAVLFSLMLCGNDSFCHLACFLYSCMLFHKIVCTSIIKTNVLSLSRQTNNQE